MACTLQLKARNEVLKLALLKWCRGLLVGQEPQTTSDRVQAFSPCCVVIGGFGRLWWKDWGLLTVFSAGTSRSAG